MIQVLHLPSVFFFAKIVEACSDSNLVSVRIHGGMCRVEGTKMDHTCSLYLVT